MDKYILKIYDTELMTFTLENTSLNGLQAEIVNVNQENVHLLPVGVTMESDSILSWLKSRVIPKNRAFVQEILKTFGLSPNDTKGIIDVCKGLSLSDCYWVVPIDFSGSFKQYNLFENRFDEMLSLVAYTGIGSSNKAFTTSPELTTNGMLPKAWRYIEGKGIYLYKGGTKGFANTGNEPYSEYYASQVAATMGLNHVTYDLENWKGMTASVCKLFTDFDTAFVPVSKFMSRNTLTNALEVYRDHGLEFENQLKSMLIFDAVIYNEDRHFGNFGLLRDNHTGKIIAPAPIFDNGLSLFNFAMADDLRNLSEYAKTRTNPYGTPFENIVKELAGSEQRKQLRRLVGFRFTKHPSINLSDDRLSAIEKHIQLRVRTLLREISPKMIDVPTI